MSFLNSNEPEIGGRRLNVAGHRRRRIVVCSGEHNRLHLSAKTNKHNRLYNEDGSDDDDADKDDILQVLS